MKVSYKKLWHLLLDKDMTRPDLIKAADISPSTAYKLSKDANVNMETIIKICEALNCDITDILELLPNEVKEND